MRLLSFHPAAKMLTLIAAAAALFVTTAGAAPRVQGDRTTVVGYVSGRALSEAVAASGGRVIRKLPGLHAAEVQAPSTALRLMSGLAGIRYAQRPVARYSLAEPAVAPAAVPGGAYEWQYAASRQDLVPASVQQAAGALTIAVVDTGADVNAPDLAAKGPATWSVLCGVCVPMPTLVPVAPRTTALLSLTVAPAPMAVALVRLFVPLVFAPRKVLLLPVVTPPPDREPINVFRLPILTTFGS